jgi:hypothetical protein
MRLRELAVTLRVTLSEVGPILVGLAVATWWVLAFRVLGGVDADYGGFVTVAERLLAGDRLYADVYDNKDPLIYYTLAGSRFLTPLGSWFLNIAWMVVGSFALWVTGRQLGLPRRGAFLMAAVATPVALAGASYFPAASHIPGVVMTVVALAAALDRRWLIAGLAVAAVVGLKLIMAPMALAVVLGVAIYRRAATHLVLVAIGVGAGVALLLMVLALRGELLPYVDSLRLNTVYSQAAAGSSEGIMAIRNHLARVMDEANRVTLLGISLSIFLGWALLHPQSPRRAATLFALLAALGTLAYSLVVIAITGLWGHHGLILIVPALLALTGLLLSHQWPLMGIPIRSLPFFLLLMWLLSGATPPGAYVASLEYARANIYSHLQPGDESQAIASSGSATTYMRVGNAREGGHAYGLRDWTLACPRIYQEVWEARELLQPTLDCLPAANVILISKEVQRLPEFPDWSAYVAGVEALVAKDYVCHQTDAGRVCRRPGT